MATEGEEAVLADDLDLKELEMELDEDDYAYEEVEIERYDHAVVLGDIPYRPRPSSMICESPLQDDCFMG